MKPTHQEHAQEPGPFLSQPLQKLALLVFVSAFCLEVTALHQVTERQFLTATVLHSISAITMSWPLWRLMPKHYRTHRIGLLFFFLLCLLVPVVSGPALCLVLSFGSYFSKPGDVHTCTSVNISKLPEKLASKVKAVKIQLVNLRMILQNSQQTTQRIAAVLATKHIPDEEAVALLRIALTDPVDEVRLLAFARLDSIEKGIYDTLHDNLVKLSSASLSPVHRTGILKNIGEAYWELARLDLVQGSNRVHMLKSAINDLTEAALYIPEDGNLQFLLARIYMTLGKFHEADKLFRRARKLGIPAELAAPFQAELAFTHSRFGEIGPYLNELEHKCNVLRNIETQWTGKSRNTSTQTSRNKPGMLRPGKRKMPRPEVAATV